MDSTLDKEIMDVINANLNGMQSKALKERLIKADEDAERIVEQDQQIIQLKANVMGHTETIKDLQTKEDLYRNLEVREKQLRASEVELAHQVELLNLKEAFAEKMVSKISSITETVFQSNRMNYNIGLHGTGPNDKFGSPTNVSLTGSVHKED